MKKIGMVVAVETEAVRQRYGEPAREEKQGVYTFSVYDFGENELIVAHSGAGEIAAAACTQLLISLYGAEVILNFGVVGGLTEEMSKSSSCLVEKVVHYDFDCSAIDGTKPGQYLELPDEFIPTDAALREIARSIVPGIPEVVCASADKFVGDPESKMRLHELYGADICEMESAGIALTCFRNGVPCLLIKTVSDGVTGGAEEFRQEMFRTSSVCLAIADRIIEEGL